MKLYDPSISKCTERQPGTHVQLHIFLYAPKDVFLPGIIEREDQWCSTINMHLESTNRGVLRFKNLMHIGRFIICVIKMDCCWENSWLAKAFIFQIVDQAFRSTAL